MPPDKPRGRPIPETASRNSSGCPATDSHSVQRAHVNTAALRRMLEMHWRGWLTRAELEAAFGLPYERLTAWRLS